MSLPKFLTFDDVGLIPNFNQVKSRLDVNLKTFLTTNVSSNIPLIPANMDSVIGWYTDLNLLVLFEREVLIRV